MVKYIIITILFAIALIFYMQWNNKRLDKVNTYWDKQEEACGYGHYQSDGDCIPVDYLRNN